MKNLFDYATKELSQDAFLRWFFENYDDRLLRPIVVSFLRTFAKGAFADIKDEDIVSITTYAQDKHIDITVSVKLKGNDKEETRYVYIEDKVLSGEHNQLLRYNKVIDTSRSERIYYKTSLIDEDERERVKAAGWSIYDINDIASFFRRYRDKSDISDIFSDYVSHTLRVYDDFNAVSANDSSTWNKINWRTFYYDLFDKGHYREQGCNKSHFIYRGMYISLLFLLKLSDKEGLNQLLIELLIRGNTIYVYYHPNFKFKDDEGEWNIDNERFKRMDRYEEYEEKAIKELDSLRAFVSLHEKEYGLRRSNQKRAFAKREDIPLGGLPKEEVERKLTAIFERFIAFGEEYRKTGMSGGD